MNNRVILAKIHKAIKSELGETIAETLVSVLISALALLLMSTAISSSVNIVKNTRKYMEDYYTYESGMVQDELNNSYNQKVDIVSEAALILDSTGKPTGTIKVRLYPKSLNTNGMVLYGGDF